MNVLVVDDHPLLRNAVAYAIEAGIPESSVTQAATVADAVAHLAGDAIDIVALDLRLEGESGLDVARHITAQGLRARCVVFTSVETPFAKMEAFETESVVAFTEKSQDPNVLVETIIAASKGFCSFTFADYRAAEEEIRSSGGLVPSSLTPREEEISALVAEGLTDNEIAEQLFLATSTVRNHLSSIYSKTGTDSRTKLARLVHQAQQNF